MSRVTPALAEAANVACRHFVTAAAAADLSR